MGNGARDAVAAGSGVRHVQGQRDRPVGPKLAMETKEAVLGRVAKGHAHAGADKGARQGLADPAGGAGDECDPVVEVRCGHVVGLVIRTVREFLCHLHDFARARYARSPDTIELRTL